MSKWGQCLVSIFILQYCAVQCQASDNGAIKTQVISNAEVGKDYSDFSVNSTIEYLFQFRHLQVSCAPPSASQLPITFKLSKENIGILRVSSCIPLYLLYRFSSSHVGSITSLVQLE